MATENIVKNAINETMFALKKYSPTAFDRLNSMPEGKSKILTPAAKIVADEEVKLAQVFKELPKEREIRGIFAKHLPPYRVALIEQGFLPQTYQILIKKKVDGFYYADFIRDEKSIFSQKKLDNRLAISDTSNFQIASIIVEAVLLLLQAAGKVVSVDEGVIASIAQEILPVIENSSQLHRAVEALQVATESDSKYDMAVAIYNLIVDTYSLGILWQIIQSLCRNMSYWDWIETSTIVTAMIIATLATNGVALTARILLALNAAYRFINKLTNLDKLDKIKQAVK